MISWSTITQPIMAWNKQRKRGLKNPITLWITSFILTFFLTILPSGLISAIDANAPSMLSNIESWVKVIVDNLYPMIITQSVVTMLQNFSIATLQKGAPKIPQYVFHISWTASLSLCLIFYIIIYLIIVYANPVWRNLSLYITSGILTAVGLGSVLQLSHEQTRIRNAIANQTSTAEYSAPPFCRDLGQDSLPLGFNQ